MSRNVILLSPINTNGGIASWTRKFISTFADSEFRIFHIAQDIYPRTLNRSLFSRFFKGVKEIRIIKKQINQILESHSISILHTTSSGSLGSWRDYKIAKECQKLHIPCIIHYRIGCIPSILSHAGVMRRVLLKTMKQFNQIWVLDKKTFEFLDATPQLNGKVYLTPNGIEVKPMERILPKTYQNYVFMANLHESKGILELVQAFVNAKDKNIVLHICGPGESKTIEKIQVLAGDLWTKRIIYYGKLANEQAVGFLDRMDVMVLPTYYKWEAFPISILEAMSRGKLVISTSRAAIPDMLTTLDGARCGILVEEKNVNQLTEAMDWIADHKKEADILCAKAYEKVCAKYSTNVVYEEVYRSNYRKLIETNL